MASLQIGECRGHGLKEFITREELFQLQEGNARPAPAIIKAACPWSARRGAISMKEKVLRTVKGILNKLTPKTFEILLEQLLTVGINSADMLQRVVSLVYEKALFEPIFVPMYVQMVVRLREGLPEFTSDEGDGKRITVRRIFLNICQAEFEGAQNMRAEIRQMTKPEQELERKEKEEFLNFWKLSNIMIIGELYKQKIIPERIVHHCIQVLLDTDSKNPHVEENVEALCHLLTTVGKQMEESSMGIMVFKSYFQRLKELSTSPLLPSRMRFMVLDTIDLQLNKWVPRRKEVKAKTINEKHAEAEQELGLQLGMVGLRDGRRSAGIMGTPGMGNKFSFRRPCSLMPQMPDLLPIGGKIPEAEQELGLRLGMVGLQDGRRSAGIMGMPGMGNNFSFRRPRTMMPQMPDLLPIGGKIPGGAYAYWGAGWEAACGWGCRTYIFKRVDRESMDATSEEKSV